jgi:hypothetical protein
MKRPYVAPEVRVLGSLHQLTQRNKDFSPVGDGDFFKPTGQALATVS